MGEFDLAIRVVYGTSQKLNHMTTGEIAITQSKHPAAYALAGLACDTKFDWTGDADDQGHAEGQAIAEAVAKTGEQVLEVVGVTKS